MGSRKGLFSLYRTLHQGVLPSAGRVHRRVSDVLMLSPAAALPVAAVSGLRAAYLALAFCTALFVVAFLAEEMSDSAAARVAFELALLRLRPGSVSAADAVALSRMACLASRRGVAHWGDPCCPPCPSPGYTLFDVVMAEGTSRRIMKAHARLFGPQGEGLARLEEGLRGVTGGLAESRGVSCCLGHRFPGVDVPLDVVLSFESSGLTRFAPSVMRMLVGGLYVAVGTWWEATDDASRFALILRSALDEPAHVRAAADVLALSWLQEPEDLLKVSRVLG